MKETLLLSIIIVNYNGKRFLGDCLDSVAKHVSCSHEIILVDNASSDGSCEFVREHFPEVRLVESKVNTGFTGGNNIGAKQASGRLILLLNNDTIMLNDFSPALQAMDDPAIGALGCKLCFADGRLQPSYGYAHSPMRLMLFWSGIGNALKWLQASKLVETDPECYERVQHGMAWVSGAFLLTRRSLWEKLGGLDESYFMYVEDVDFCARVSTAGFEIAYIPDVLVLHYAGYGRPWIGITGLMNSVKSYLVYTKKFHDPVGVLCLRMGLSLIMFLRAIGYGAGGLFLRSVVLKEKNRGYLSASLNLLKG